MNAPENLRQALNRLDTLPAIPYVAQKILSLKIATDEGERALLELIEQDPAILSRIVGLSNSPLFGTGRKIMTLKEAAALLGSKRVKMVALGFAMMSAMAKKQPSLLDVQSLWQHSLSVAMTMDSMAHFMPDELRPEDDEIYLAGLLHDIGFLVLDSLDTRLSDQFHARLNSGEGGTVEEVEAEMLGMSHGELGAALARYWHLPERIIAVLNYHHTPDDKRAVAGQPLLAMANLAEILHPMYGMREAASPEIGADRWRALGIDPARAGEIVSAAEKNTREVSAMFQQG